MKQRKLSKEITVLEKNGFNTLSLYNYLNITSE